MQRMLPFPTMKEASNIDHLSCMVPGEPTLLMFYVLQQFLIFKDQGSADALHERFSILLTLLVMTIFLI